MQTATTITPGELFDLANEVVGLDRATGIAGLMTGNGSGPPRIDGYTVGAPREPLTAENVIRMAMSCCS